ncbi:MAG: hypothetical protein FK734_07050 [Asgard group archaeon]|nr:hypothetical protein [Asgard group archaeon]
MAELANTPTILAIVMMGIAFVAVFLVVVPFYIISIQRKRRTALMLATAFAFWDLGGLAVFICALLQRIYLPGVNEWQYARLGINIGYAFSAISNIFMVLFIANVFSQAQIFRKTQKTIPIINAILNGVTVGLIINTISESLIETSEFYHNPNYPIPQTVYHLALTIIAFLLLLAFSARSRKLATFRWERAGFTFIIGSALAGIMIYVSFALDVILQDFIAAFETGYTVFNILGWIFAIFMAVLGYLGYIMPKNLRNAFREEVS